ncbi:MAG: sugar ABC transporter permease [Treponemataceae bacterium]
MTIPAKKKLFNDKEQAAFIIAVLAPIITGFLIIRIIPIGQTFVGSFFNWSLIDGLGNFIGVRNYVKLFADKSFYSSFMNTMSFTFFTTLISVVLGLFFAYLINRKLPFSSAYETIIFIPVVLTFVPVCLVWMWLLDWENGFINVMLKTLGFPRISWLATPAMSMVSVIIVSVWKVIGYNMIIFSVGLKSISRTFYEAAEIDGARPWTIFRRITLPLLKPITLFVTVMSVINNLKVFTQFYIMTQGKQGGGAQVDVLVSDIYARSFVYYRMGSASAEAMILLVVVLAITWTQFKLAHEEE